MAKKAKYIDAVLRLQDKMSGGLDKATKKLAKHEKTFKKLGGSFTKTGGNFQKVGKSLTKSVTAPIVGIGVTSVKLAADFEKGMSKVQSISGASKDEIDKLSEKAKEMGKKTKFSATESADAFSYMAMAGWKTEDMLNGIEGIMYLAGATGEDLATTSDIVTDALTAFGLTAKDTDNFVDVLAATANNANTNVSLLGESFKYVAPVAGSLGYSIEDTSVALGIMANSGIKASSAGTALRSMLTNLAKPGKSAQAAMDKLGISLTDAQGKTKPLSTLMGDLREKFSGLSEAQKAQYAAALAGKTGMSGLLAIVNTSQGDFDKLTQSINNADGAAQKMYETANDNLTGKLTTLKSTLESIAITIGEKLSPYIKKITDKMQEWGDKIAKLDDKQLDMIIKIAGVAAVIGPLLIVIGKVISSVGKVMKSVKSILKVLKMFSLVGKAIKKVIEISKVLGTTLKALFTLNPKVMIVIGVIAALALIAIVVYKNWDKIKPVITKVIEKFKEFGAKAAEVIAKAKVSIVNFCTAVKGYIAKFVEQVRTKGTMLYAVFTGIREYIGAVKRTFSGIIQFISGVFTGNWKKAWEGVKNIFGGIFQGLAGLVKQPLNVAIGIINKAIEKINGFSINIPEWVPMFGGKSYSPNIAKIPMLAKGTKNFAGGMAIVGERGAEIVQMPRGAKVSSHDNSVRKAYNDGKNSSRGNITVAKLADTIIVREEADIDKFAEKFAKKLDEIAGNVA